MRQKFKFLQQIDIAYKITTAKKTICNLQAMFLANYNFIKIKKITKINKTQKFIIIFIIKSLKNKSLVFLLLIFETEIQLHTFQYLSYLH